MSSKKKGTRGAAKKAKYRDDALSDDEEFVQTFDVTEKLRSKDFPRYFIRELAGNEVCVCVFSSRSNEHSLSVVDVDEFVVIYSVMDVHFFLTI